MNLKDKYINPLTDFGFKKLFGVEPNKELLIDFLNQLLPSIHQIKNLTYTKNEHLGGAEYERKAIFDLYCESESGEKFIVEVQKAKQNFFKDRSVYYSTFPIQEQAKKGDWDFELSAVYTIGILDFVFDDHKDQTETLHTVKLKDQNGNVFYNKLTYIYLELPKFTKSDTELQTRFDKWMYVFRHLGNLQNRPDVLQERIFEKLFKIAEIAKFTPKEKNQYEESLKYYRDLKNVVDTSKEEGKIEGKIEGKVERSLEIATNLIKQEIPLDVVAKATGLSKEEIEKLQGNKGK